MGVPVSPRNIFPSNIQGLPTWYEVRVSEQGYLGRRGGVDLMVAMNPQTWDKDVAEIEPGGYLFYDSTKPLPKSKFRDDITVIGMPLTAISNDTYTDPRQRQLFKNIIYVGALSALLDIDPGVIAELIGEQYKGKEALLKPNVHALQLGRDYALAKLACPLGIRVKRANAVGKKIFIEGNNAAALGCVYGGATVAAWYPITPSSSMAEAFQKHCKRFRHEPETNKARYAIIQGEDELASIGIVIGAAWNGARAFTCTSGPGISLMQEFIGLAYFAEIPAVLVDVQRGGPSTGMPTRTQQSDVLTCAYASHGDTKHPLLFPEDPKEAFEFAAHVVRPRRPAADAGVPDARPRHRHERAPHRAAQLGRLAPLRPRQGDDPRRPRVGQGVRPLSRRRRRRHPVPHLSRHASDPRRLLHPRHDEERVRDVLRGGAGLHVQHAAAAQEVRDREDAGARSRC